MSSCSTDVCGIGGWGGPLPGDPDNNSILSATSAFGGIDVSWSFPTLNPQAVAHTLLFRAIVPSFSGAVQHRVVQGDFYYDKIDADLRYYYWIKIVSVNGTVGELIGPASAMARPTIEDLIEQLTGKIDAGVLAQSLKADLDKISVLNANLLNEIMARENGEITLAEAMAAVDLGLADALTFIHTEVNSLTTADSALAESLNLVAATLNDTIAAVSTSMTVTINALTGVVNAMWTAQVNVNGLIGGFGIINDGTIVEAGFDVDRFWIGRTSANKRKPFIVEGDTVYIDEAAINKLTFSKLRDEAGTFVVEDGKVKAQYLKVSTLSVDDAAITNAKIGGDIHSSGFESGVSGWYLNRAGNAEFNNIYARGNIQASSVNADTITATNVVSNSLRQFYTTTSGGAFYDAAVTPQAIKVSAWPGRDGAGDPKSVGIYLNSVFQDSIVEGGEIIIYGAPGGVNSVDARPTPLSLYFGRVNIEVIMR